jgi:hypothetical protein
MAYEDGADRAGDVGEAEGRQRHDSGIRTFVREEHVREDQGRGGAEDKEVIVFDGAAHEAGDGCPLRRLAVMGEGLILLVNGGHEVLLATAAGSGGPGKAAGGGLSRPSSLCAFRTSVHKSNGR